MMKKNIENKGITATCALKNEIAGKAMPLFGKLSENGNNKFVEGYYTKEAKLYESGE
jgi:hypothetical protein